MSDPNSLYVHVPFCRHRCGYCNFAVVANRDEWIERYIDALLIELESRVRSRYPAPLRLQTLYLGGGTPSHLAPAQLDRLLSGIHDRCALLDRAEISIEANPLDACEKGFESLRARGVNRVSLGLQSFSDRKLAALDRDHTGQEARTALDRAMSSFARVSIDLIFAAPDETRSEWDNDLKLAIAAQVHHVSTYGLTIEKGTRFWSDRRQGSLREIDEECFVSFFQKAMDSLIDARFEHYEVSNFAKPGCRSRHNQIYWQGNSFEAIGCGAARYVDGIRATNHASPKRYMQLIETQRDATDSFDDLSSRERAQELAVIGMRQLEGISIAEFRERHGYGVDDLFGETLADLIAAEFLKRANDRLQLTPQGLFVSDSVWTRLLNHQHKPALSSGHLDST